MSDLELYPRRLHPEDFASGTAASGSATQPGAEVEGPPLSPLEIQLRALSENVARLSDHLTALALRGAPRWETQMQQTDANGDLTMRIFTCPAGYRARISRVVMEAAGYTPAVPYSNAAAFVLLSRGIPAGNANQMGGLIDFAPATAGGALFPGLFEALSDSSAYLLHPEEQLWARVETGPASVAIVFSALITLEATSPVRHRH